MKFLRAIIVAGVTWGFSLPLHAELVDGINVVVHDSVITYQEVEQQTAQALPRQYLSHPQMDRVKFDQIRSETLETLLERQLILHEFKTAGYNIPESIIDEEVQKRIQKIYGDRATLTHSLQADGMTYEKYRQQVRDQIIIEALQDKNVRGEIMISPHKIENYYLGHTNDYKVEDQVKLRMIMLTNSVPDDKQTRQLAEEILAKIKEGTPFSEMASVYSQDSRRSQGGDRGWVERSVLNEKLAGVAFSLKPGVPSDIIELPEVCCLMLVENKRPAHFKALNEVRDEIEKNLLDAEKMRLRTQWIDRLKKKTFIHQYF